MYKIPWCVVLTAINDQPRYDRKPTDNGEQTEIRSETEARAFFNI